MYLLLTWKNCRILRGAKGDFSRRVAWPVGRQGSMEAHNWEEKNYEVAKFFGFSRDI